MPVCFTRNFKKEFDQWWIEKRTKNWKNNNLPHFSKKILDILTKLTPTSLINSDLRRSSELYLKFWMEPRALDAISKKTRRIFMVCNTINYAYLMQKITQNIHRKERRKSIYFIFGPLVLYASNSGLLWSQCQFLWLHFY